MLASSSGASISSSTQKGSACSGRSRHERDGRQRLLAAEAAARSEAASRRLGHDLDAALEDILLVEQRPDRLAAAEQRRKVTWKLRLIATKASRKRLLLVSSIRLIASPWRDRLDEIPALDRHERDALSSSSNCSIAIM